MSAAERVELRAQVVDRRDGHVGRVVEQPAGRGPAPIVGRRKSSVDGLAHHRRHGDAAGSSDRDEALVTPFVEQDLETAIEHHMSLHQQVQVKRAQIRARR